MSSSKQAMQAKKSPPSFSKPQTTVTIAVSSGDCKEIVYKEFLCYHSPFFNAAFNISFAEGQTQTIEYPDTHPHVFGIFVQWIYTQTLERACYKAESATYMVELWILADRFLVPALQKLATRVLCGYNYWFLDLKTLQMAYEKTGFESPLRRLLIKAFAICSKLDKDWVSTAVLQEQILFDVAFFLKSTMALPDTSINGMAYYLDVDDYLSP